MTDDHVNTPTVEILSNEEEITQATEELVHVVAPGIICRTEARAKQHSRERIVLDATDGFIPLWAKDQVLRWRFHERSLRRFRNPQTLKLRVRSLFAEAISAWGVEVVPIRFVERRDNPDFEIVVETQKDCTPRGCVLASAFFPDAGRHTLQLYPTLFEQSKQEQVETMAHELGHVFGLRHFFALRLERSWPAVIFGDHEPFSIMNYGAESTLTGTDRKDLTNLYQAVWQGQLTAVNGTPIQLVKPYHMLRT